jgi:hypothetical protein
MPNYRCSHGWHNGRDAYPNGKSFNANKVEPPVWRFVSAPLQDPSTVHPGLETLINRKSKGRRGDVDREAKAWLDRLAEADKMRRASRNKRQRV